MVLRWIERWVINIVISVLTALDMPGSMITEVHLNHVCSLHILISIFCMSGYVYGYKCCSEVNRESGLLGYSESSHLTYPGSLAR